MFEKAEGPTSLRLDLVWALAFSLRDELIELDGERFEARAGMAAMWNGVKGQVVVLVRRLEPPAVERYRSTEAIGSCERLFAVVDAGHRFAESLGFKLDIAEFRSLPEAEQKLRVRSWNQLRKVRPPAEAGGPGAGPGRRRKSVLGKISLVRKGNGIELGGRLRSFF